MSILTTVCRRLARLLSLGALLFVLVIAVGEGMPLGQFGAFEAVYMALFVGALLSNVAAWRWQVAGASLALLALLGLVGIERARDGGIPGPWFFAILGVPACSHLVSWWLDRSAPKASGA